MRMSTDLLEPICSRCPLERICKIYNGVVQELDILEETPPRMELCPLYYAYLNALSDFIGTEKVFHIQSEVMGRVESDNSTEETSRNVN